MRNSSAMSSLPAKVITMPSIKRHVTGSGAFISPRSSQRLSQASLQKVFFSMLACVAICYFLLIIMFFRRHDLRAYRDRGDFNNSIKFGDNGEIWKQHLEKLTKEEEDKQRVRQQASVIQTHAEHRDLEDPDFHEMLRPEEIQRKRKTASGNSKDPPQRILTAFASRNLDNLLGGGGDRGAPQLKEIGFPKVSSCIEIRETWDTGALDDPFLPKIRGAFFDGDDQIHIAAQNPVSCVTEADPTITKKMQLQAALYQSVPVKRIAKDGETKYRVTFDEEDTQDVFQTRFLCRFEPSGQETLSTFNPQHDNPKDVISSDANLFIQCPVPKGLAQGFNERLRDHSEQTNFTLTLVPFRTSPRAGGQEGELPPCYLKPENESSHLRRQSNNEVFFLPKIADTARWENIPICLSANNTKMTPSIESI